MMQVQPTTQDLLLARKLTQQQVARLLKPYGFKDIKKADANLQSIGKEPRVRMLFSEILEEALLAFSESPDPDLCLNNFERFSQTAFSKIELFSTLKASPLTLYHAAKIFGGSPFLSDILIRNPEYFYWVFDPAFLKKSKKKSEVRRELAASLKRLRTKTDQVNMLRIFKRKEILRIGVRDLIQTANVRETLREVSNLADVLIEKAHSICERALRNKYGRPLLNGPWGNKEKPLSGFSVMALGKLGGRELNFSSDVDLIYLYGCREGKTAETEGAVSIQNAIYFEYLAKEITAALNASTEEGYVYRVDLRLRPEGEMGLIALPLEAYRRYYKKRGETWERMVLLKTRPVSGDPQLGKDFLKMVSPFIYENPCGRREIDEIKAFKEKIDEKVSIRKQSLRDVKRGFGGIREIEFIVQTLQLEHGKNDVTLRTGGMLRLLKSLTMRSHLSRETERHLREAYLFLRNLENKLQMFNDQQTHLLPIEPADLEALALRLGYSEIDSENPPAQLRHDYQFHTQRVHQVYQNLFYLQANS